MTSRRSIFAIPRRLSVAFILVFMSAAQISRAFRVLLSRQRLGLRPHYPIGPAALSIHSSASVRLAKASSDEVPSAAGAGGAGGGRGKGPRKRNVSRNEEEELFAALTSQETEEGRERPKKKGSKAPSKVIEPQDLESPVVEWAPQPGSVVMQALQDLRVSRTADAAEEGGGDAAPAPSGRKPKKEWTIDTNWESPKPLTKGRKQPPPGGARSRLEMESHGGEEEGRLEPPVKATLRASSSKAKGGKEVKGKMATAIIEDEDDEFDDDDDDDDDDDGELDLSEETLSKIRFIDISGEKAEWEDLDEDDMDEDDESGDEEEVIRAPSGRQLSMQDRLANAQKGAMFNPYIGQAAGEGAVSAEKKGRQQRELDGDEESGDPEPIKYQFKIVVDVGTCPGCGNCFQTKNESVPGFIPTDVYDRLQRRAAALTPAGGAKGKGQALKRDIYQGLSPEQEVELLVSGKVDPEELMRQQEEEAARMMQDDDEEQDEREEDLSKHVICQRCHRLKHYGVVEDSLRPGWSENEMLTPERFREMVSVVRRKRCAIVVLVDIFDFHGSLLYNLARVVGDNPVMVAVNKADLLPSDFKEERVKIWVRQQLDKINVKDVTTRDIFLISGKSGMGVKGLLRHMKTMARLRKRDLYVIGAANVGKSTFINRLIELGRTGGEKKLKKKSAKKSDAGTLVTTSALPGTTLNFIEVDLGDRVSLFDTPGLIIPHQLTTLLNTEELKAVIPQKRVNHVTLRLGEGKSVLMGGLARLDFVTGRPFLFTFFISNDVKLHLTSTDKCDEFLDKHLGTDLIFPPFSKERLEELGPWTPREFNITGTGWKTSAVDIVISGLGWISVTGALDCTVRVMVPDSVGVRMRDPLMPYETWDTTARWTGLRAVKTNNKKGGSR